MSSEIDGVNALLPCPHCGEREHLYPGYHWPGTGAPYCIDCLGCGADFTPREGMDVIAMWNRRTNPSSIRNAALDAATEAAETCLIRYADGNDMQSQIENARWDISKSILALKED